MNTFCHSVGHSGRWKVAAAISAMLFLPTISSAAEVAAKAAAPAAAPAHAAPAAAPAQSTPQAPAQSVPQTPAQTPTQTPVMAPAQTPSQSPSQISAAPNAAVHAQASERTAADNDRSRNDNRQHFRNGSALLIPGYYGDNYWDNGWVSNQTQYYGQFQQNDNNTNQPAAAPEQTPAYYEPAGQADSPSLSAALKASPAYMEVDAQERAAQSEYDAVSQRVIEKLKQSPDYLQALQTKSADAATVSAVKANDPNASPEKTEPAAQAKLNAAKSVSDMQREALAADPQAVAAKEKLDDAVARREAIRAQVRASLPNSPAVKH